MVSLEDEMTQKDKEAAVLKANHKYEMLLNIELERMEKCKRTYEHFHNFEVALMKERHNRILQKQCELKSMKNASDKEITDLQQDTGFTCEWSRSQPKVHAVGHYLPNSNKTNSGYILDPSERTPFSTVVTKHQQPKSNYTVITAGQQDPRLSGIRRAQNANNQRTHTNASLLTRLKDKPNSGRDLYFHESAPIIHTSSSQDVVKFPVLYSASPPGKSPTTTNCTQDTSTVQRYTHFPENLAQTRVLHSRDVRKSSTVSSGKKKLHRTRHDDNLTPFDHYRLRLQESEQRTRKPKAKHHFSRAISAMETTGARNVDDVLTKLRRTRSADLQ